MLSLTPTSKNVYIASKFTTAWGVGALGAKKGYMLVHWWVANLPHTFLKACSSGTKGGINRKPGHIFEFVCGLKFYKLKVKSVQR